MPNPSLRQKTRLNQELARLRQEINGEVTTKRAAPLDAFNLATRKWIDSERIDIGAMAEELGVGRTTLFRWVGSRELLTGEVIWSLYLMLWNDARKRAKGNGPDYIADVMDRVMTGILAADPLRRFLDQDPEYALRILTSKTSVVQSQVVAEVRKMVQEQVDAEHIAPALETERLAYLMVRIVESFLYSDQITGQKPDIEFAIEAVRILVSAQPVARSKSVKVSKRRNAS